MEKVTKYKNLIKVVHELYCDYCHVPMEDTNIVITTYPVKYSYRCPQCGASLYTARPFPWEEYIGEKINE